MRLTSITIAAVLALAFVAPGTALACKCAQPPAPKESLKQATAVFAGTVTKIERAPKHGRLIHFAVSKTWKGVGKPTVTVTTGFGGGDCGYGFKKGVKYIVYCYGKKQLSTNICTRTRPLAKAQQDLKELGPGKEPGK
jgi:hypothetical protein